MNPSRVDESGTCSSGRHHLRHIIFNCATPVSDGEIQVVQILFNRTLQGLPAGRRQRNFDVFDLALNHAD